MEESGQEGSVVCIRMHTGFESGSGFIVGSIATATVLVGRILYMGQEQHLHSPGGSGFKNGAGATSPHCWWVGF